MSLVTISKILLRTWRWLHLRSALQQQKWITALVVRIELPVEATKALSEKTDRHEDDCK